jgi:hypothetical protein
MPYGLHRISARSDAIASPIAAPTVGGEARSSIEIPETQFWFSEPNSYQQPNRGIALETSTASSSSAGSLEDIFRLIPAHERAAFHEMLDFELRGRELSDDEMRRRVAENTWRKFLKDGWPK